MNWNWNFIVVLVVVVYVGLWIADIATATPEARKLILLEVLETSAIAGIFGTFMWWIL